MLVWAAAAAAQDPPTLSAGDKFKYHFSGIAGPSFTAEMAASAGVAQWLGTPLEWGQGGGPYGKRLASAAGSSVLRRTMAFALDASLHEDPTYRRAGTGGVLHRMGHAAAGTVLTRTDSGTRRFSTWRFGSAFGAAYLSNQWYPDRLNTVVSGFEQGAAVIGGDLLLNLGAEFWPDIKRIVFRRRRS
jgi:hypothetical protein